MADIVIAGYLGFENGGDEVILSVLCSEIKRRAPRAEITVLSMDPEGVRRRLGVGAVHRYDLFSVSREFSRSRVFVFGGGSLLQDATSRRSLCFYLSLLRLAQKKGMKTMLLANGIGPLLRESSRRRTAKTLSSVGVITLRDDDSAKLLSSLGVTEPEISVTADPAFLLAGKCVPAKRGRRAVVSVRGSRGRECDCAAAAALCRRLYAAHGLVPLLLPMQTPADIDAAKKTASMSGVPYEIWGEPVSVDNISEIFDGAELTVGMRLHALIFSSIFGVPFVGIDCDPKVLSLCRDCGMPCVPPRGEAALLRAADEVISARDTLSQAALAFSAASAVRAASGIDALFALLNGGDEKI